MADATTGSDLAARFPGAIIRPFNGIWPRIADDAFIAPGAVVVGDVTIGPEASVWYGVVLRGDDHRIRVGARTNIQDGTIVHVFNDGQTTHSTEIGAGVIVGHAAKLHGCMLEDGCLVGIGAIVLDGATVGREALVAAGALVSPGKVVPARQLWAGSPARFKRDLTEAECGFLAWNAQHYVELGASHKA
ncbi:MAG: gamma carbonic anhydrase family protein [Alphaproteobacteria bacterium]